MNTSSLQSTEYATFYKPYIEALGEVVLMNELEQSLSFFINFLKTIPIEKQEFRYAEGKWTIKDIVQHLIDAERIFVYRALRIARKDKTPLPGFEENEYVETAFANNRAMNDLMDEFTTVRKATISLFKTFTEEQLLRMGTASEKPVSVRAIGFITLGHQKHHEKIIKERYLK
ncbi:DinB family protein [Flavobacterium sp.]|uniref:DinB family protein n=1 Tax=Flavobacterium sp. TaxID=239 RepID=UPI0025C0662D|nr:DinB family protein [Flavobacterium sp.]MBA4155468.1 damage-inducible protein DinB [Flavobacterium sp.]